MFADGNEKKTDYICVYAGGELVGGIEPNGKKPTEAVTTTTAAVTTTTTTTTTITTTTTEKATTTSTEQPVVTTTKQGTTTTATPGTTGISSEVLLGDVNLDGAVSLADLIMMQKYTARRVEFNAQQEKNADCEPDGMVNDQVAKILLDFLIGRISQI